MAEKLALGVQGEELVFLANERNIEFIIPQKALKFLCYAPQKQVSDTPRCFANSSLLANSRVSILPPLLICAR